MKYFLMETNEKNRIPYNINKNRAIDIRMLTKEGINGLKMWNVVEMEIPMEVFFPDLICRPFVMVSDIIMQTIMMYDPDVSYKAIKLWAKINQISCTYFLPILSEVECISNQTIYNSIGNRILHLVLEEKKIKVYPVFQVKKSEEKYIIGREDFIESLLRRGIKGIRLKEIDCI